MLADYLKGYYDYDFIVSGFTQGFALGLVPQPDLIPCSKRYPVKEELKQKVMDEVSKGQIIGPFLDLPEKDLMISPVCVIPKPNSTKHRMIFNLSQPRGKSVNDNIDESCIAVTYCSVADVIQFITQDDDSKRRGWFMGKLDLADAYRIVPIRKTDWKFLGMRVGEEIYIDRCLPMGAASSCRTFQRISDALAWTVMTTCPVQCTIFNYLDDFLVLARDQDACSKVLKHFTKLCEELGFPLASQKTVWSTQVLVFLGIGINTRDHVVFIPQEKAEKTLRHLRQFVVKSKPLVSEWQSILGKMNHLTQVISAGRPYMSSLYESLAGVLSQHRHVRRCISLEAKEDLQVWEQFLTGLTPRKTFKMYNKNNPVLPIYTDASKTVGYGGVFGSAWFMGSWPDDQWKGLNICVLELYPVYAAIVIWASKFSNETVEVHTDNQSLVSVLNRLYSKDRMIRWLLKPLAMLCLNNNIHLVARHIPGAKNIGPDMLSRGKLELFREKFGDMQDNPTDIDRGIRPESLTVPPVANKRQKLG